MGLSEIIIILLLCIIFLKPKEIEILSKNISYIIININKYINSTKEHLIKTIDLNNNKNNDKENHK